MWRHCCVFTALLQLKLHPTRIDFSGQIVQCQFNFVRCARIAVQQSGNMISQRLGAHRVHIHLKLPILRLSQQRLHALGNAVLLGWQSLLGNHPDWEADVFDFSRSMEGCMAALAAERRTDADLKRIEFWLQKFEEAYQSRNRAHQEEADIYFHQAIAEAAHNILFAQLSGGLLNLLYRQTRSHIMHTEIIDDPRPTLIKHHRALFTAIANKQPREAAEIAEGHLRYVADSLRQDREYLSRSEHADTLAQHDAQRAGEW